MKYICLLVLYLLFKVGDLQRLHSVQHLGHPSNISWSPVGSYLTLWEKLFCNAKYKAAVYIKPVVMTTTWCHMLRKHNLNLRNVIFILATLTQCLMFGVLVYRYVHNL
jgi:hypothetical protein